MSGMNIVTRIIKCLKWYKNQFNAQLYTYQITFQNLFWRDAMWNTQFKITRANMTFSTRLEISHGQWSRPQEDMTWQLVIIKYLKLKKTSYLTSRGGHCQLKSGTWTSFSLEQPQFAWFFFPTERTIKISLNRSLKKSMKKAYVEHRLIMHWWSKFILRFNIMQNNSNSWPIRTQVFSLISYLLPRFGVNYLDLALINKLNSQPIKIC